MWQPDQSFRENESWEDSECVMRLKKNDLIVKTIHVHKWISYLYSAAFTSERINTDNRSSKQNILGVKPPA